MPDYDTLDITFGGPEVQRAKTIREKFWQIDACLPGGKVKSIHLPESKEALIFLSNPYMNPIAIKGALQSGLRTRFEFYSNEQVSDPSQLFASYNVNDRQVSVHNDKEPVLTERNGTPRAVLQSGTNLLRELQRFVDSTPELYKKSRYSDLLKPMIDSYLDLAYRQRG